MALLVWQQGALQSGKHKQSPWVRANLAARPPVRPSAPAQAIVVTAGSLLLATGLKPGTEAAIKMQERDK